MKTGALQLKSPRWTLGGWGTRFKIVGNRQGRCIHDINADQSRRTEHLIDTSIIINLLRTSFADNPYASFYPSAPFLIDQSLLLNNHFEYNLCYIRR